MTHCVLDASVALAWVLPGEAVAATDQLLDDILRDGAAAPALWLIEVAATLTAAERRQHLSAAERTAALGILSRLPVVVEPVQRDRVWTQTIALASQHRLTVYDATYLEAALRLRLPLATLGADLVRAAAACGIAVLGA